MLPPLPPEPGGPTSRVGRPDRAVPGRFAPRGPFAASDEVPRVGAPRDGAPLFAAPLFAAPLFGAPLFGAPRDGRSPTGRASPLARLGRPGAAGLSVPCSRLGGRRPGRVTPPQRRCRHRGAQWPTHRPAATLRGGARRTAPGTVTWCRTARVARCLHCGPRYRSTRARAAT